MILNLKVEEEAIIVWSSPFRTKVQQLGFSFAMGKLQHDMKHTILVALANSQN
jgi:hypothetical protein